jgi:hypothetical protein
MRAVARSAEDPSVRRLPYSFHRFARYCPTSWRTQRPAALLLIPGYVVVAFRDFGLFARSVGLRMMAPSQAATT